MSGYLASLVKKEVPDQWPPGYLEAVVGSCAKAPIVEPPDLPLDDIEL